MEQQPTDSRLRLEDFIEARWPRRPDRYVRGRLLDEIKSLVESLQSDSLAPTAPGLYVLCARDDLALGPIEVERSRVVYVGKSGNLAKRDHIAAAHSGFSTPRRTIGALLRERLHLRAVPRSPGPIRSNLLAYRFDPDGERQLSAWIAANLRLGWVAVAEELNARERNLVGELAPPLNLTHWSNPWRTELRMRRAQCVEEARANRIE